ncbi:MULTISPECIES: hypothetical protein [Mycobacteroides]|uniref:Phage tail protein n=2 Tax=Mycobacteroides TaxID=670516 RepID=A0ABR5LJ12_9MYCO|nr:MULTISPECIES: hypothetical protein [Mycobacteroides]QST90116.1 major tail protein [Mycobacterium phage prophiGD05-2]EIV23230.1 hypothetical protein MA3A0122R_4123 [Mycobacteroides abscessus 3A-0122-R]EIV25331.1 hypothetical protein MA3A0119R_3110 [Mycobacteroides abscessus 3A-0119-R]EIV36820.1 hypothetical protein MA3A0731_3238 [Mycobacteroides abscessus 3A-0731]EIV43923.1 hypothetical protein MA3A0930R_5458 [Mycobacteroides abscessus 3A-0930-R]
MAGNADNVKLWDGADVLIYTGTDSPYDITSPATTNNLPATITDPWPALWKYVGLLHGDNGFENTREWNETDITAWGYGVVKVASKNLKVERKFTALEDNETTTSLIWPGSTDTAIVVPKPASRFIAFQLVDDLGHTTRYISKLRSRIWAPNANEKEGAADGYGFTARIFPNSNKELFALQKSAA